MNLSWGSLPAQPSCTRTQMKIFSRIVDSNSILHYPVWSLGKPLRDVTKNWYYLKITVEPLERDGEMVFGGLFESIYDIWSRASTSEIQPPSWMCWWIGNAWSVGECGSIEVWRACSDKDFVLFCFLLFSLSGFWLLQYYLYTYKEQKIKSYAIEQKHTLCQNSDTKNFKHDQVIPFGFRFQVAHFLYATTFPC